jgi:phasin family protein
MTDTAAATIESAAAETQKTVTAQMEKMSKSLEDVAAFNQESVEALSKSAEVAMKAAEEMNAEVVSWSKRSMEESVAAAKEIAASKSVMEVVEKQTDFAKSAFDGMFKQMTRMNEMALAASKDAMAPMTARMSAAADMMKTYAS